jgi:hypothetical protein
LATTAPLPSPILISSQFSDSGQNVVITFDAATDQAGYAASFRCDLLLIFPSATLTTCLWVNSSAITVSFGVYAENTVYLAIGDSVSLRGSVLKAFCSPTSTSCSSNLLAPVQSVITMTPNNPVRPVVIISSPSGLSSCSNLSLDATGSYGSGSRTYTKVEWTVTAVIYGRVDISVDVSEIQRYLNALTALNQVSRPFIISAQSLTKATYTLTLALTNFLGLSSYTSAVITIVGDPNIPILSIIGPTYVEKTAATALNVLSAVQLSSCATSTKKIQYTWSLFNVNTGTPSALVSTNFDMSKYSLPAYSLAVGSTYTLIATASQGSSSVSAAPVTIFISQGLVTAAVVGGYIRSTPIDLDFILDASISSDADERPSAVSSLAYTVITTNLIYALHHYFIPDFISCDILTFLIYKLKTLFIRTVDVYYRINKQFWCRMWFI